jgi:Cft2 family RNA processing exonuclease
MFTYSDHIFLHAANLALDPPRRANYAFVSHGHSDHIGRHVAGIATPATVSLVARRLGVSRLTPLAYDESVERSGHRVSLAPAGHVLGAAQIVVDDPNGQRLVYTGDFSVRPRPTVQPAQPIHADILIMECTFGNPQYVFPPDDEIRARVKSFVERALLNRQVPVILGYALGKAQEAMALVHELGFPFAVDSAVGRIADVYRRFGVDFGEYAVATGERVPDQVLIAAPGARRAALPARSRTLYLSGWALDRSTTYRMGVDEAIPLSDHADFDELVAFVRAANPGRIYTTHGPSEFADHLVRLGFRAEHLGTHQPALF